MVRQGDDIMKLACRLPGAIAGLCLLGMPAYAADLVYTPINPSFGGNPANSSHLLAVASAQKDATAWDAASEENGGTSGTGTSTSQTNAQLFVSELESRLLSSLAEQVDDAIFGTNPQDHGTVTFGDTTVVFDRTSSAIDLTVTDSSTGEVTDISVPLLVTSP